MAVLPDAKRVDVWADQMRSGIGASLTKPELRAAVDAIDN